MRRVALVAAGIALVTVTSVGLALSSVASWKGTVAGKDGSKITGTATMAPAGEGTEVNVMIMGDEAGVTRPWHIHIGSCAKGGGVFGGGRSYTPIAMDGSGHGMTKATLAVAAPDTGSYYVNVHESAGNMGKIVACGDLAKSM